MATLQPLLPSKLPAGAPSVFPPISDPAALPIAQAAMGGGLHSLLGIASPTLPTVTENPGISAVSTDPLITRKDALEADLYNRTQPKPAPTTTLGKIGHIASNIGNALGDIFAPSTMALIPGTDLHNERIEARDKHDLDQISALQTQEAGREQTEATTEYTKQRPEIEKAKVLQHLTTALAPKGIKITENPDGTFGTEQDPDSPYTHKLNALSALQTAQAERTQLQSENLDNKYKPGTPQYEEWNRKLQQADERLGVAMAGLGLRRESLGLTRDNYLANNLGVDPHGNPLPGAMVTDDGQPVGAHFSTNVRPTGQERNKADMANSADEQLGDIAGIMQKHPTIFGPGYGQSSAFKQWLGSEDPDAQRFLAARTIAADHLAGTFGGRSEAALDALDKAIGQFKDNPQAALAGIDQLRKANTRFQGAGTVRTAGSKSAAPSGVLRARDPQGVLHEAPAGTPLPQGWKLEK